jgi:hypothetical protein
MARIVLYGVFVAFGVADCSRARISHLRGLSTNLVAARGRMPCVSKSARPLRLPPAVRDLSLSVAVPVVRLWFGIRRAIHRAVDWQQASRRQRFTIALGALCALSIVTGGALAAAGVGQPGPFAAAPAASVNRALAATWVEQQVSPAVTVSCDPAMCHQLRANGFPAVRLKPLPASPGSLGSGLVVATPEVRQQFGTALAAADAPLVIAGFGSGAGRVDVRVIAANGAAAFRSQLAGEHAALVTAGGQLLRDRNIQVGPAARTVLRHGGADPRLLATLSVLATGMPIRLVAFGDLPPGASGAVPLRSAQIGATSATGVSAILAFLHAQQGTYRPARVTVARTTAGQSLVTVWFAAQA